MLKYITLGLISVNMALINQSLAEKLFISGQEPSKRPKNAPVIASVERTSAWYTQALHGISEPYPYSLRFLEAQGNWNTPFTKPGMTGRYDIRSWHK